MTKDQWTAVDRYLSDLFVPSEPVLDDALHAASDAGLPAIYVAPNQGKLLAILAQSMGARSILEIGTLGGYSAIWLARALPPDGTLLTLEADSARADVARPNIARAGLADRVEVRVGRALDTLPTLAADRRVPFDLVFIDADKQNYPAYLEAVLPRMAKGGIIIADNVLWSGKVLAPPQERDEQTAALIRFADLVNADPRLDPVMIPLRDGVLVARVK